MSEIFTSIDKFGASYSESSHKTEDFELHFHNVYELYYFIDGDVDYLVEGRQYHPEPNSILLLAPYVLHGVRINSAKTYKRFVIHFNSDYIDIDRRSFLLKPFPDKTQANSNEVYYTNVQDFSLYSYCHTLVQCNNLEISFANKLSPIYLEALLAQLTLMHRSLNPSQEGLAISETVANVVTYINLHLCEKLRLDDLSKRFFISKNHLNRLFQQAIGTTVFGYIVYKRIGYAQHLLDSGVCATKAAIEVGFGDYSSFYRAYKKITGHSPTDTVHF